MWRLSRPTPDDVRRHLESQRHLPFSYEPVGATRDGRAPVGFDRDHNRELLGTGAPAFAAACAAVRAWRMFAPPLVWIEPQGTPISTGDVVGVVAHALGVWWLNAARIVYVIDEPRWFGFAYGTLPGHVERGEERFSVEWLDDDTVWYDLMAFSRPHYWGARLVKPFARRLQRRFVRLSKAEMCKAVRTGA
jgi:uncharacterized protein (UPF0548 family)